MRKYLAVFLLLIIGGAFAKTVEEGVNINSFMDAVSYLKAAIDLGANKGCFDPEPYANSIRAPLKIAPIKVKYHHRIK